MKNTLVRYLKNEKGLVTIEWVGISAVVVLAAVIITSAVMHSASLLGGAVITNIDTSCTNVGGTTCK